MNKGTEYVIKPCAVGYGIYDKPYWYQGRKYEPLHKTYPTKQECIDAVLADGATYVEESEPYQAIFD